ncbi:uncharacterized protein LOC110975178 isoform X2 [Acanthaster planci]|nr:uncharacterized protein LOC110975178 isoform X2 [Acanthaster planci]XP_022083094.1 uncharacterized protein LOC110975178 isoform X2 [Acanthaster planci]XP_022083095.1 uncharacterized protein LOC110975178 isoform X2 [Acanthaster planci]
MSCMPVEMSTRRRQVVQAPKAPFATKRQPHTKQEKSSRRKKAKTDDDAMATSIVTIVTRHLRRAANPDRAPAMAKYMRDQFTFYGIGSPDLKSAFQDILAESPAITQPADLRSTMLSLWRKPEREYQHIALKFAERYRGLLLGKTADDCRESARCLETLLTTRSWWDTIDSISPNLVGYLAKEQPAVMNPVLEGWITHSNMWLRRTAILHQLKYKHDTDQDKLFRFCLLCCHEKEFFIQKSIGWALRNHFRIAPQAVKDFVKENKDKLAPLSKREALKHA